VSGLEDSDVRHPPILWPSGERAWCVARLSENRIHSLQADQSHRGLL
jgi:hypothetical protein